MNDGASSTAADTQLPVVHLKALHPGLGGVIPWPERKSEEAAGFDLCAAQALTIAPTQYARVRCGFAMAMPVGFEAQVRPRSGLALNHGVTVLNSPGTIDSDYRGEVAVLLVNHGSTPFIVEIGMRIAQLVIARVADVALTVVHELPSSKRGAKGFGSTGA